MYKWKHHGDVIGKWNLGRSDRGESHHWVKFYGMNWNLPGRQGG